MVCLVFSIDFDLDGNYDLATANLWSADVSILLGNGDGTFQTAVNYAVGTSPYSVFAIDLNGDGYDDLATAIPGYDNVSILLGNGDGTFQTAVNYATGKYPRSVFSIDLNGDGYNDLATANRGNSSSISILLNLSKDAPIISITRPTAGEVWSIGDVGTISWDLTGGLAEHVDILLSRDAGATWEATPIASFDYMSIDHFDWTVTGPEPASYCKVKVVASNSAGSGEDESELFTIASVQSITLEQIVVDDGSIVSSITPSELTSLSFSNRIRVIGRVLDSQDAGIPNKTINIFDPVTGNYDIGEDCIFSVTSDEDGYFIYPDTLSGDNWITTQVQEMYGLWFKGDSKGIPLVISFKDDCVSGDCVIDSLQQWFEDSDYPVGTVVGIADASNPMVTSVFPYPPNDLDLDSPDNDLYFEGYVWCFNGDTTASFLHGPSGWLERGLNLIEARSLSTMETLHEQYAGSSKKVSNNTNKFRVIAIHTPSGWDMNPPQAMSKAVAFKTWDVITYVFEGAVCVASIASGPGAFLGCAPLAISLSNDLIVKPHVVPWVCEDRYSEIDPTECQAIGEGVADGVAFVGKALLPSPEGASTILQHIGHLKNPRNLHFGRPRAAFLLLDRISNYSAYVDAGVLIFEETGLAASSFYVHPSNNTIQSFGFDGMRYVDSENPYLDGYDLEIVTANLDQPKFSLTSSWDDLSNPSTLTITAYPDRQIYDNGTFNSVSPYLNVTNSSTEIPFAFDQFDHDSRTYSIEIPVGQLPNYIPGESFFGEAIVSGYDLNSNLGNTVGACQLGYCGVSGIIMETSDGSGIVVPPNGVNSSTPISVTSLNPDFWDLKKASGSTALQSSVDGIEIHLLGNAINIAPDTVSLLSPATISMTIDPATFGFINGRREIYIGKWNSTTNSWNKITTTIDQVTGELSIQSSSLGIFAPIISDSFGCCADPRGDVDGDGANMDIVDLTCIVDWLFGAGCDMPCPEEADADGDGSMADIVDLTFIVDWLFGETPTPVNCP